MQDLEVDSIGGVGEALVECLLMGVARDKAAGLLLTVVCAAGVMVDGACSPL